MDPSPDGAGSLVPVPSHGHSINEDPITSVEPFEPAPWMDKGKQLVEEGLQRKRKRVASIESDKSISDEGLLAYEGALVVKKNFSGLTQVLIQRVSLQMSQIFADNFPVIFVFPSNG